MQRHRPSVRPSWHRGVVDNRHCASPDEPVGLIKQLFLQRSCIPDAISDEMVQLTVNRPCKAFRHRLAFALTRADQPSNVTRTHPSPGLMTQAIRACGTLELVFPIRRRLPRWSALPTSRLPLNLSKKRFGLLTSTRDRGSADAPARRRDVDARCLRISARPLRRRASSRRRCRRCRERDRVASRLCARRRCAVWR